MQSQIRLRCLRIKSCTDFRTVTTICFFSNTMLGSKKHRTNLWMAVYEQHPRHIVAHFSWLCI